MESGFRVGEAWTEKGLPVTRGGLRKHCKVREKLGKIGVRAQRMGSGKWQEARQR